MRTLDAAMLFLSLACVSCASTAPVSQTEEDCVIGSVSMREDRSLFMMLRVDEPDGLIGDAAFEYKPGDPQYNEMLRHVAPIEPGQNKFVRCWPDGNAK